VLSVAVPLVVLLAIVVGGLAIAGDSVDDEGASGTPTATAAPSKASGGSSMPQALGAFPPEFIQCLKDRGVDIEGKAPQELFHGGAVSPQVLNACFGALHGGGAP
jgi:hypothetical protein